MKTKIISGIILGLPFIFTACGSDSSTKDTSMVSSDSTQQNEITVSKSDPAKFMTNNCYSCHNPKAKGENKIAPTLKEIKTTYLMHYAEKNEFVSHFESFVNQPSSDKTIMKEAVEKYGIMPNMQYSMSEVKALAQYIFETDIETDAWLAEHYNGQSDEPAYIEGDFLSMGKYFAMSTKSELGKNLKKAIKTKGTKGAVTFCNTRAYPITDSMATVHQAGIKRVSDKNRNPNNQASEEEVKYIQDFQAMLDRGEEVKPVLVETNEQAVFYTPIVTNEMCIQCHGPKQDLDPEVLNEINSLYPKDLATGYDVNQVRGIWQITMKK